MKCRIGEEVHGATCILASGTARKYVLLGRQSISLHDFFYAMKHQVGNSAEWYSFKRRPWPTQVCVQNRLLFQFCLVRVGGRQDTRHKNTLQMSLIKQCLTRE